MKKLIYVFLSLILSTTLSFGQGNGNNWYLPSTSLSVTSDNTATVSTHAIIDYVAGCCSSCSFVQTAFPSSLKFVLKFNRTSSSITYPTITVNGVSVNFYPDGITGYVTVNTVAATYTSGCPSGNWTAISNNFVIKVANQITANYDISVYSATDHGVTAGCGLISNAAPSITESLVITPTPDPCPDDPDLVPYTYTIDYTGQWTITSPHRGCENLTFTNLNVVGSTSTTSCTSPTPLYNDYGNDIVVNGSSTHASGSVAVTGTSPLSCSIHKFKVTNSVTINGVAHTSGQTFTVNGHSYKVIINHTSCTTYHC